jgi:hypothetical protein
MNKRIKELADQCRCEDWFDYELFAELLIMECMTICEELGDRGMDGHYCADEINKTFRGA